jgi:hypothetical protein
MTKQDVQELRRKIIQGMDLSFNRLLTDKQKTNGDLVISRDGKVVKVKAREFSKIKYHQ